MDTNHVSDFYFLTIMNILSIDYGEKRVGLAISLNSSLVQPLKIIYYSNKDKLISALKEIVERYKIELLVIGLPIPLDFKNTDKIQEIKDFGRKMEDLFDTKTVFVNEVMSTKQAQKILKSDKEDDAVSAALILQSYLDSQQPETQ